MVLRFCFCFKILANLEHFTIKCKFLLGKTRMRKFFYSAWLHFLGITVDSFDSFVYLCMVVAIITA